MKQSYSTKSSLVMTGFPESDYADTDLLIRYRSGNEYETIATTQTKTVIENFNAYLANHARDINLLRSVIFWQKKTIDYQALHTAFLLNSISEEEFEHEAEKFIIQKEVVSFERIASEVKQLDTLIGIKFDTSDYADYFQCSQENVISGLRLLLSNQADQHLAAMLPTQAKDKIDNEMS